MFFWDQENIKNDFEFMIKYFSKLKDINLAMNSVNEW